MQSGYDVGRDVLKIIAIVAMTIDHVGAALYPEQIALRIIGRLAFPLFSYLLVLGVGSERNVTHYLTRLFVFGLISQAPFSLAFDFEHFTLNIFFTLFFGVLFLSHPTTVVLPFLIYLFLDYDYGPYGIILIGCMRILNGNTKLGVLSLVLLSIYSFLVWDIQVFFLLSLPLILLHKAGYWKIENDVTGTFVYPLWKKYSFYLYYPLHLTILYLVRLTFPV